MEVEMLKMFSGDSHPHLISLLATYEQFRAYYLIFPWADSDLSRFWSDVKPKPLFDMDTILWVAKQCKGIAHGLISIHKYQTSNSNNHANGHEKRYGRHGDLKPENILWFCDDKGGTLKISDFGLSEYNTITNKSYITKSRLAWSVSYRPPECDLKNGRVGPSYDIWTLGCLYLEFITWLLGGWELVSEFTECRMSLDLMWWNIKTDTFFELVEVPNSTRPGTIVAMVKPAVTEVSSILPSSFWALN
jgi:serine/threonine protein kinase